MEIMVLTLLTVSCLCFVNLGLTRGDLTVPIWQKTNRRFKRCAHEKSLKDEDTTTSGEKGFYTTFATIQSSWNPDDETTGLTSKNQNNVSSPSIQTTRGKIIPSVKEGRKEFTNNLKSGRNLLVPSRLILKSRNFTTSTVPTSDDKIEVSSLNPLNRPEGNRPPFSGQTGGNFYPQLIPPGSPWPSKEEDASNSSQIPVTVVDRIEVSSETPTNGNRPPFSGQTGGNFYPQLIPPGTPWPSKEEDASNSSQIPVTVVDRIEVSSETPTNGNRPPLSGQTGGNFYPQLIPPGNPWPSKEEDASNSSQIPVTVVDRIEVNSETPTNGNRPPFSGQTGGNFFPQLIPPGTPWPSKLEDYTSSTRIPVVGDRIELSSESPSNGNRPPFAGQTGGHFYPQLIPPGTPWPSKPEDYTSSTKNPALEDRIEASTVNSSNIPTASKPQFVSIPSKFQNHLTSTEKPLLEDTTEVSRPDFPGHNSQFTGATQSTNLEVLIGSETTHNRQLGNRPPFSGQSGGHFYPQLIPAGSPWPSRAESSSPAPNLGLQDRIEANREASGNRVVEVTTSKIGDGTTVTKQYINGIGLSEHFKPSPVVESNNVFVPQIVDPDMLIFDLLSN